MSVGDGDGDVNDGDVDVLQIKCTRPSATKDSIRSD